MDRERTATPQPIRRWQRWLPRLAFLTLYVGAAGGILSAIDIQPLASFVVRAALVMGIPVILIGLGLALPSLLKEASRRGPGELPPRKRD